MKVRLGFVSNSSSTSYCVNSYGIRLYHSDLRSCINIFASNLKQVFADAIISGKHRFISQIDEIEEVISNESFAESEIEMCTKIIHGQIEVPFQVILVSDYIYIGMDPGLLFTKNNFIFTIDDICKGLYDIINECFKGCEITIPKFEYFSQSYNVME